jgi:hypothetical protein
MIRRPPSASYKSQYFTQWGEIFYLFFYFCLQIYDPPGGQFSRPWVWEVAYMKAIWIDKYSDWQ